MLLLPSLLLAAVAAPPAPLGSKVEAEKIQLVTEDKLQLAADYWAPSDTSQRAPAAILLHDAGGDRSQVALFAERLNALGLAVLAVDLRGHGESSTEAVSWSAMDTTQRQRLWAYAPRDLEAAAAWLRTRREVHTANLTLVGLRGSCALAANRAASDTSVRAVVLIDPTSEQYGFDLKKEVAGLAGLETKVVTPRDNQEQAELIRASAVAANDGLAFVEIDLCRSRGDDLLHDRRVASDVAKWVQERVLPKKGRR